MSNNKPLAAVPASRRPAMTPEEREQKRAGDVARIGRLLVRLQDQRYFGKITITLNDGNFVELRTEQVLKADDF